MEKTENTNKTKWYSIREAAEYLDVGEPTLYRWMREGKITFRKVGDSTRFWQEDLDSVMQVSYSARDLDKAREVCPVCHHDELVEGKVPRRRSGLFRSQGDEILDAQGQLRRNDRAHVYAMRSHCVVWRHRQTGQPPHSIPLEGNRRTRALRGSGVRHAKSVNPLFAIRKHLRKRISSAKLAT